MTFQQTQLTNHNLFLLGGVIIGSELWRLPPWGSALVGFGTMSIAWLIAKAFDRRASRKAEYRMSITRILYQ